MSSSSKNNIKSFPDRRKKLQSLIVEIADVDPSDIEKISRLKKIANELLAS